MSIAKPFTFVANTYAKASEVNANFDTVYSQVNSNISAISQNAVDIENLENNKADINGSSSQRFGVADAITDGDAINKRSLRASIANSINYISGFIITKDSGSPNDTIIVSEGSCYDSTKTVVLNKNNSSTKTNGSQAASATYYIYVIGNSTGSSVDILISESSTTPGLPSGYILYRQIGYYTTDSDGNIDSIIGLSNSVTYATSQITSMCMPDYSLQQNKSSYTTYTADTDGYIYIRQNYVNDSSGISLTITYNDTSFNYGTVYSSTATSGASLSLFIPCPKGATYIASGNISTMIFIPCKGGN